MTIATTPPAKPAISTQTGFTAALHRQAVVELCVALNATSDGPYGAVPLFDRFDAMILIAGGSGAAWAFVVCMGLFTRTNRVCLGGERQRYTFFSRLLGLHMEPYPSMTFHKCNLAV
jgi:hypothetical protein